jgi:hypothetical protein
LKGKKSVIAKPSGEAIYTVESLSSLRGGTPKQSIQKNWINFIDIRFGCFSPADFAMTLFFTNFSCYFWLDPKVTKPKLANTN